MSKEKKQYFQNQKPNKVMKNTIILILTLFLVPLIVSAQSFSEQQKDKTELELDSVFDIALAVGEKLDLNRISNSVNDYHKAGHIINGVFYSSFETIMSDFRSNAAGVESQKYDIVNKEITILSENAGIVASSGNATVKFTSGTSVSVPFAWTFVYEKINGEWMVVHSHRSSPR